MNRSDRCMPCSAAAFSSAPFSRPWSYGWPVKMLTAVMRLTTACTGLPLEVRTLALKHLRDGAVAGGALQRDHVAHRPSDRDAGDLGSVMLRAQLDLGGNAHPHSYGVRSCNATFREAECWNARPDPVVQVSWYSGPSP